LFLLLGTLLRSNKKFIVGHTEPATYFHLKDSRVGSSWQKEETDSRMNKMAEEINRMSLNPNKNQEGLKPDSKKPDKLLRSRHQSWILIAGWLALVLGCLGNIPLTAAHFGLDPEIEEITEELTKNPDNVDLLINRGQVYRSNGEFIQSLQDLERAWLLDRENRTVILQRALTLSALGRDQEAKAALDYLLQEEFDPKRVFALAERARIRARSGHLELAIADFTAAIQLQPTIELYLIRGNLQESLGKLEAAEAGYQDGLSKLGDAILLKNGLIRVQIAQKQYGAALALIDEEVTRSSVKTPWYLQRAEILALLGKSDATRLAYQQALSEANRMLGKRPTAMHLLTRAKVYYAMDRIEEAKRDLRLAGQKAPYLPEVDDLLRKLENR
jgi:tetratricopeptide (TPR) repeat protein